MAVRTLADAVIAVRPDFSRATAGADAAGQQAGRQYADGFDKNSSGKLRQSSSRAASDAEKVMAESGGRAGTGFGTQFGDKFAGKTKSVLADWSKEAGRFLLPVGIVAAVAEIGKIGTQYEDNLNIFQAVTRASGVEMDKVAEKARQLGADVKLPGVSAAGAAEAMTELAKAGLSVQQSMDAARATLQLARAASISEAQAAEITGNAINAFGLKAKDTTFVVDELAAAANSSSVEIGDVSDAFKQAAAVFSSFQGPAVGSKEAITELNTAIAILGNNGIKGRDAGTSLKQMLLQLTGPSQRAHNEMEGIAYAAAHAQGTMNEFFITVGKGKNAMRVDSGMTILQAALTGTAKQSGLAVNQLADLNPKLKNVGDIAYDSSGKMRPLKDILSLLGAGLKGQTQEVRDYALTTIFGADATRSVIALMKGGLPTYEAQRKAVLQQGAAADVAAAKNKGLKGAIDNVRSQVENAAISIYNSVKGPLTKSLNDLADGLSKTFDFIGNHIGQIKDLAVSVGIVAGAFYGYRAALIAVTVAQRAWAVAQSVIAFVQLASEVRSFAAAWTLLDVAMDANPIGLVVVAIGALVAGIIYAWHHSETFRNVVLAVWGAIKTAVGATVNWFVGTVWPALVKVWNGIAAAAKWAFNNVIMPVVRDVVGFFRGVVAPVFMWLWHNIVEPVWHAIAWIIKAASAVIQLEVAIVVAFFRKVVAPMFLWLWHNVIEPVWQGISKATSVAASALRAAWNAIVGFLRTTFGPVFTWLWHNVIEPVWKGIRSAIKAAWDFIKPIFDKIGEGVKSVLPDAFHAGVTAIKKLWQGIQDAVKAPVTIAVRYVLNPLIRGFDALAGAFGTPKIPEIAGFAAGGRIPGVPSRRDNLIATYMDGGRPAGKLAVASGEYIVNTDSSQENAGLLETVNKKHGKVGLTDVLPFVGAYADGGGIGGFFSRFLKGAATLITDPKAALTKIANVALGRLSGAGEFVQIIRRMGASLVKGVGDKLAGLFSAGGSGGGVFGGPTPTGSLAQWIAAAIRLTGVPITWTGPLNTLIQRESGGNPRSINLWDSNAKAGDPSRGLMQTIGSTFAHYRLRSLPNDIYNPVANIVAGIRYILARYGTIFNVQQANRNLPPKGYESGGLVGVRSDLIKLAKVATADTGHVTLDRGWNLIGNGTGGPEYLSTRGGGEVHLHIHNEGVIGSQAEVDRWLAKSVDRLVRDKRISSVVRR